MNLFQEKRLHQVVLNLSKVIEDLYINKDNINFQNFKNIRNLVEEEKEENIY